MTIYNIYDVFIQFSLIFIKLKYNGFTIFWVHKLALDALDSPLGVSVGFLRDVVYAFSQNVISTLDVSS